MYARFFSYILSLLLLCASDLGAQDTVVRDSVSNQVVLLGKLVQSGNFEQAQLEAVALREYMESQSVPLNPATLVLLSDIYRANRDDRSIAQLLSDAESDARNLKDYSEKTALLEAMVRECKKWLLPERAFTVQSLVMAVRDSQYMQSLRALEADMQLRIDSIAAQRGVEVAQDEQFLKIERNAGLAIGGGLLLSFIILLVSLLRNNARWQKMLSKRELEWEIEKGNLRKEYEETAAVQVIAATRAVAPAETRHSGISFPQGPEPDQIALLIEPNRQVVLYLKSLLSDRFRIETARTAIEGLQMASDMLPDLVVCDALLNGQSGIEIARQIKLAERTNHIPVVLLTNKFGNEGKLDALRAGADVWFTRPVIDDEFDASVQRLMDERKLRHEDFVRFIHLYFTDNRIPAPEPFLQYTVEFIEQNLGNPDFMATEIAKNLQLSNTHFTKKLMVLTGKEPVQLIRELRLEKARVLLEKRAGTPNVISELVGFSSPGTFSLAFKDYFGENTLLLHSVPGTRPGQ
ncbi:MAG: helix-turn-helix domain-containing protein [Bacteroidota bacterium]